MIDLHIHTTYSDGSYSVKEILQEAQERKLEIISITDHDCIDAYQELNSLDVKNIYYGQIITGCEFKCVFSDYKLPIEILGYGFETKQVKEFLNVHNSIGIQSKYLEHLKTIGKEIGLVFDENIEIDCNKKNEYASAIFEREINKNSKNKQILKENNIMIKTNFYRDAQSNKNTIFYIDETKDYVEPETIIDLIHKSGGKAFLAHPYIYSVDNKLKMIEEFIKQYNIDGLECYYSLFSEEQTYNLLELCKKFKLYTSGGTDFHGINKPDIQLAIGKGNLNIDKQKVEKWIKEIM